MQSTNTYSPPLCDPRRASQRGDDGSPVQALSLLARAPCAGEHSSIVCWSLGARAGQCPSLVVVLRGGARGAREKWP
ncbi:hypothetical protein CGRA01v4_04416 [Colletotrichum graminicola]|nr:hypothetical protein CGRA01v4_04416 [Colletotrichum graminicola]